MRWRLTIADVEGAFLQGDPLRRSAGRIFAAPPRDAMRHARGR